MTSLDKTLLGTVCLILAVCLLHLKMPWCALVTLLGAGVCFGSAAWATAMWRDE